MIKIYLLQTAAEAVLSMTRIRIRNTPGRPSGQQQTANIKQLHLFVVH